MKFHCAKRVNENKKEFKMVRCHGVPNIVSIPNGCIPFCGGQVMFELAHTFGGSIGLCAIEFDVISNFIWLECCKVGIYLVT